MPFRSFFVKKIILGRNLATEEGFVAQVARASDS